MTNPDLDMQAITIRKSTMNNTALDFLTPPEPPPEPRPVGQQLDDVKLSAKKRLDLEREDAEATLDRELRAMQIGSLYDLKRAAVIPPILLTVEQITALVNLMLRIFSLGFVKRENVFADMRAAKESLAERAAQELLRRKRTPASVADRLKLLSTEKVALERRELLLGARSSLFYTQTPAQAARSVIEWAHAPEIPAHRGKIQTADERAAVLASEIEETEGTIPIGIAGFLSSRSDAVRLARAKLEQLRDQQQADERRRKKFVAALESMIDAFEVKFAAEIAAEADRVKAERIATTEEVAQLRLELRDRIPSERREIERIERMGTGFAERSHPTNDANDVSFLNPLNPSPSAIAEEEAEAERARLRRLLGKGG